jgi:hypothetical protein
MKQIRSVALFALILLCPAIALAQATYQGNLTLVTQVQVDAAGIYTAVNGNLQIGPSSDILDLSPLDGLESVNGTVLITGSSLVDVDDAFPALTFVRWGIYFYENHDLVSFSGFNALPETGDNIEVVYHDSLVSFTGFESLHTAGWSLDFSGNPLLVQVPEFSALEVITSSLFILENNSLEAVTGFGALQQVGYSFTIDSNPALNSLCGFYAYLDANNPYTGGGSWWVRNNGPGLPVSGLNQFGPYTTEQDILDGGSCPDASSMTADLLDAVEALNLSKGSKESLGAKLDSALKSIEKGSHGAASNQLLAFTNQVRALVNGGQLTQTAGDALIADAMAVWDLLQE